MVKCGMKCMQIRFRVVYVQRASICDRWRFRFNVDIFHSNPSKIHMFSSFVSPFFCRFSSIHRNQIMWHLCFSACDTIINRKKGRSSYLRESLWVLILVEKFLKSLNVRLYQIHCRFWSVSLKLIQLETWWYEERKTALKIETEIRIQYSLK